MKHIKQSFLPSLLLAICLYTLLTSACVHDEFQTDDIISIKLSSDKPEGRMLTDYQAIRLLFDFTQLVLDDSDLYDYIVNVLLPPAKNYFSATLKVPATTDKFGLPGISTICAGNITVPTVYQTTGVDADLVIFVTAAYEPTAAYVAYSMICLVDSTTNRYLYLRLDIAKLIRPVGGLLHFNTAQIMQLNKESQREADLVTAMHEMTHIFGFSSSVYNYYIDATTGNTLSGHYTTTSVWGKTVAVLNVDPLTSSIKDYFGCTSLTGAYLEDEGSSGSVASHFERRIFYNEYMTSSRISDARISAFTLGLLEGSGWYQVDYSMAEPMTWGQGRGCSFASNGACMNTGVTPRVSYYPEFCSTLLERGCSYTSREGAMCGNFGIYTDFTLNSNLNWWGNYTEVADAYSDNCPIYQAFSNTDCEDPDNIGTAKISGSSSGYGSKCFMGTLSSSGSARPFGSYCFTPTCATSGGSKVINVQVADTTVTCVAEGYLGVPGFSGSLYCPDPDSFCNVLENEGFCRRKCMGRGSCVGTTCQCVPGWGSFDCGLRVYELCDRCSSDSKNPFCYGDGCGCDPSSSKCKGLSIGVIIAIAVGGAVFLIGVILVIKFRKTIMGKIRGKKPAAAAATATARTGTGAPRAANAPNLSNSIANPAMQNSNSSARPIAKPKRVVVERLQSNIPTSQEQRAPEEISPALSSSIRQVRLDFHESRSNHNVQTSPMREFMSDRAQVAERISPKGNNIIQERSVGGGSKPPSLMKLPSQAGGSQQNIVSPKGIRNDVIVEQAMEGTPGVKPSSLRRLASQTMGGSQNNMK